jgi:chemotaxis protein methyltransferase CheR
LKSSPGATAENVEAAIETVMRDEELVSFLRWALPRLRLRWEGFRKVRRQVGKRLGRRLDELGLQSLDQYRDRLQNNPAEWGVFDGFCRITISCLYRDKHVFDTLGARVLPELGQAAYLQDRAARCWCAGCACGEEVYTVKLLWELDAHPRLPRGRLEIIGSDVDPIVLRRAGKGCFSSSSLKAVPTHWRDIAFTRDDDCYCVRPKYRDGLAFLLQDIRSEIPAGPFDLILCRNLVFTYFDIEQQREMIGRIAATLRDGGYLVIGAHEQLPEDGRTFAPVSDCRETLCKTQSDRPEGGELEHHCREQYQA